VLNFLIVDVGGSIMSLPEVAMDDNTQVRELHARADLDRALQASHEHPILLFTHSRSCGLSRYALDLVCEACRALKQSVAVNVITVQDSRILADVAVARLGVRHQTPQALVVRNEQVVWSRSHSSITSRAVRAAIRAHGLSDEAIADVHHGPAGQSRRTGRT
jgi:bacillithiol system protein YtxJ